MAVVQRLTRRAEFLRAARQGRKWATPGLVLQAVATPLVCRSDTIARLGFTASRKVGNAVMRNRVKRRLREVARAILDVHGEPGYDYVLIGRPLTATRSYTALLQDLETALKRLGRFAETAAQDPPERGAPTP